MRASRITCFLFAFFLILIMLFCYSAIAQLAPSTANLSTTWSTTGYSNHQLLVTKANEVQFSCGFECDGTSCIFSVFIWEYEAVWSANRNYPVRQNAILNFTAAGELFLQDADGSIVWTTNTAGKSVVGMNLTELGNLVLFDDHNSVVWQSFDYPTDTLLLGQMLFQGQKLTSSSKYNLSEGMYSLQVTDKGVFCYVESNPLQAYKSMFVYSNDTNKGRSYIRFLNGSLSLFIHSSEPSDPDAVIDIPQASSAQVMKLMSDGHLNVFERQSNSTESTVVMVTDLTTVFESYSTVNLSTKWKIYSEYQPILFIEAKQTLFGCGFLCEEDLHCIFAIFISPASDPAEYKVVWSANRDNPVSENAVLNLTAAGELVLTDIDGSIVWTTNTAGKSVAGMNLTDTGNLVLFDVQNLVVWQSFDNPTDCLLLGQRLYQGQKLKSSVSSTNSSEGIFSLQVTDKGLFAYVESNPPQAYYSRFNYRYGNPNTNKDRKYIRFLNGSLSFFIFWSEPRYPDAVIDIPEASSAQFLKLMSDGHLNVFEWQSESAEWTVVTDLTAGRVDECNYPLVCGRNAICKTINNDQRCSCPVVEYFRQVNSIYPELGCSEITPLTCNSAQDQYFFTLPNVTYFTSTADLEGVNAETCKQACLNNCSCKAAFFQSLLNASTGRCFLPSEIFTMTSVDAYYFNYIAFIKVQNVKSHRLSHQVATVVGSTIGSFVLLLVVGIGLVMYVAHKRKRDAEMEEEYIDAVPGMPTRFSYDELKTATEKFSKKLGEGGFGSVFEGSLKDESKIAVKCLEGLSHIKKSFLAEVQSIGSIHHVNLVRLRGFCTWKSQRFLVYDFMSNGSLDRWIYHGVRKQILEWECRKKVILDIAKGLAYLHEECRQKIVHLDIKPQNILLDNDFNAKVSDFGLSKLIDKTQTEVMSTIKGTPGYIAPEWRSSIITEKLDVYSFGIVLLEILCGRKIFDRSLQPEESWYLLSVFQKCWEEGTLLDMVDRHSEDMQEHNKEVVEMMKVAAWCLQTNFNRRPSMSSVVKVLEGGMNVESNLDHNFTDPRIQEPVVGDEKEFTILPSSLLSGPR